MKGEDVFSLPPDTSEACCEVADQFGGVGGQVQTTQVAMMSTAGMPGWLGESATAYLDQVCRLKGIAQDVSGVLMDVAGPIKEYGEKVRETRESIKVLWQDYDDAYAAYERKMHDLQQERVDFARTGVGPMSDYDIDRAEQSCQEEWEATQAELRRAHQGYLEALDEQARVTAVQITAIKDRLFDMSKPHGTREEIGVNLFGDLDLIAVQNEMKHAAQIAPEMAAIITNPNPSPEDLEEFWNQYGNELGNPFVTNMLLTHVSAEELADFAWRVRALPDNSPVRSELLHGIGTTIVLGTGGTNLDGEHADEQVLFEKYKDQITLKPGVTASSQTGAFIEELKTVGGALYNPNDYGSFAVPYYEPMPGYAFISNLIGEAGRDNPNLALGPAFFEKPADDGRSLAEDIVAWDAETLPWVTNSPYRDTLPSFGPDDSMYDPMHAMYTLMDQPECLNPEILAEQGKTADPALLAVDRERFNAVQEFLVSDTPAGIDINHDGIVDSNDEPMNMTRYLTGGRTMFDAESAYGGFQDGGEQFGRLIAEMSMPELTPDRSQISDEEWEQWKIRDKRSTGIAGNFLYGYQDALTMENETDKLHGQDVYGYTNSNLRSWSGEILAPYMEDIAIALENPGQDVVVASEEGGQHRITFGIDLQTQLLGNHGYFVDIGFDRSSIGGRAPAVEILYAAAELQSTAEYNTAFDTMNDGGDPDRVIEKWTPLKEALFTASADSHDQEHAFFDRANRGKKDLIKMVMGANPLQYIIESNPGKYVIGQGQSVGIPAILDIVFPTDTVIVGNQSQSHIALEKEMEASIYETISTRSTFEDADMSPQEFCYDEDFTGVPFLDDDGAVKPWHDMSDDERASFKEYLENHTDYGELFEPIQEEMMQAKDTRATAFAATGAERSS
ncbi:hypothetical protein EKN07_11530 [Actinobaculum sp. 352]|nr:hypothetical protein EKN07_11530 [Actinobaculum sp. 352]